MKQISFYLLFLLISLSACRKDLDEFTSETDEDPSIVLIESTIRGKVIDENGTPIPNAFISVGTNFTTSNQDGSFLFTKTEVKKTGDIVIAKIDGYFKGVAHSNFAADGSAYVEIKMMNQGNPDVISPTLEQVISKPNGLKITIPPNVITTQNGNAFTGNVGVYARWIDPTDDDLGAIMPGALNATDENGDEKVLATYGMLAFDLKTESGVQLQLKPNTKLDVEIPIPSELINDAPAEIPLWEYNLEDAKWLENGACIKEGEVYLIEISDVGYWNCDVPLESICLSAQVFNADSSFAPYLNVIVEDLTDNFIYWGFTDSTGYFCGSVPQGAPLKITIKDHCDNIVYMEEIGPYSEDFQLEDIYIDDNISTYSINVMGRIHHCFTTDIPQGHLAVRYPGTLEIYPFTDADFNINLSLECIDFPEIELNVYSTSQYESTITTTINTDADVDLGDQPTCEALIDSFALIVDGFQFMTSPTQYYLKPNQTTDWMIFEGLSGAGKFTLELRDYQGTGQYTQNVFFKSENAALQPDFYNLDTASPDITVNITLDDGMFIVGNYSGTAIDDNSITRDISGDFKIKKAP